MGRGRGRWGERGRERGGEGERETKGGRERERIERILSRMKTEND